MVDPFCFALKSRLAGIAGRNKPLINMKAHLQRCAFCFAFIWFRVQGSRFRALVAASPPFLLGDARKWYLSHQSLLRYEGRNRLTCMVSDPSAQSPLVLAGGFTHRAFSSAQDDDTGKRKGSYLGDTLRVLELSVLYTIRVGP